MKARDYALPDRIIDLMADGRPRTGPEIARAVGAGQCSSAIWYAFRKLEGKGVLACLDRGARSRPSIYIEVDEP